MTENDKVYSVTDTELKAKAYDVMTDLLHTIATKEELACYGFCPGQAYCRDYRR